MATKRTKSVGEPTKEYWDRAAKQFSWPIDYNDKQILVPEDELHHAEDDLMVQHFRKHGWHIQSTMEITRTKVFVKPETPGPIFRGDLKKAGPIKEEQFHCDDKFRIVSTGTRVIICEINKKSITLKYLDVQKDNITTTAENLARSLKMGVFEIIF